MEITNRYGNTLPAPDGVVQDIDAVMEAARQRFEKGFKPPAFFRHRVASQNSKSPGGETEGSREGDPAAPKAEIRGLMRATSR